MHTTKTKPISTSASSQNLAVLFCHHKASFPRSDQPRAIDSRSSNEAPSYQQTILHFKALSHRAWRGGRCHVMTRSLRVRHLVFRTLDRTSKQSHMFGLNRIVSGYRTGVATLDDPARCYCAAGASIYWIGVSKIRYGLDYFFCKV